MAWCFLLRWFSAKSISQLGWDKAQHETTSFHTLSGCVLVRVPYVRACVCVCVCTYIAGKMVDVGFQLVP